MFSWCKHSSAMAPKQNMFVENYSFMTCLLWVDTSSSGWQKDVQKVLKNIQGVTAFRMHGLGIMEVSGTVNPQKLMKKLGKKISIVWFQFGDCSTNLFMPESSGFGGYGGGGGRFLRFDGVTPVQMNNPFRSTAAQRVDRNGHCSAGGSSKVITGCRVADEAKTAAYELPPPPPKGGEIGGCCLM